MLKIRPVVRQSLVDTVVGRIREVIEKGHLKPGDRLPTEAALSSARRSASSNRWACCACSAAAARSWPAAAA
jgi:hypothetical protein